MSTARSLEVNGTKINFRFIGRMKRKDFMKVMKFMQPGDQPGSVVVPADFSTRMDLSEEVVKFLPDYVADLDVVNAQGEKVPKESFYEEMIHSEAVSELMLEFLKYSLPQPEDVKN